MRLLSWATSGRNLKKKEREITPRWAFTREERRITKFKERLKRGDRIRARYSGHVEDRPCLWNVGRLLVVKIVRGSPIDEISRICMLIQARKVWIARGWVGGAERDHPARVGGASVSIMRGRHSFLFILLHPPLATLFQDGTSSARRRDFVSAARIARAGLFENRNQ